MIPNCLKSMLTLAQFTHEFTHDYFDNYVFSQVRVEGRTCGDVWSNLSTRFCHWKHAPEGSLGGALHILIPHNRLTARKSWTFRPHKVSIVSDHQNIWKWRARAIFISFITFYKIKLIPLKSWLYLYMVM